jgi:tRNA (cytidine/uridine-2'-O-)-methyltransferase
MEIALYRPEIPQNTGNIGRISVCTGIRLNIIGEPSFSLSEAAVKRAGLDYWKEVDLLLHQGWTEFEHYAASSSKNILLISRFSGVSYTDREFAQNDIVVFGRETDGLPVEIREEYKKRDPLSVLRIPVSARCRSLNLSNAVSLVLYEALRQTGFTGLVTEYDVT